MHLLSIVLVLSLVVPDLALSGEGPARRLNAPREGTVLIGYDKGCGHLSLPTDGNYETAIAWADAGVIPPVGGAVAQQFIFPDTSLICAVAFDLTQIGQHSDQVCDIYIWSGSKEPSAVVFVQSVTPGPIAIWPTISRHFFSIEACVTGTTWVGYWPGWPGGDAGWYLAADVGEDAGTTLTFVAPGIAEPSGWQPLPKVWEGISAIGVTVLYNSSSCAITPMDHSSWGQIKALYAHP